MTLMTVCRRAIRWGALEAAGHVFVLLFGLSAYTSFLV